MATDKDTKLEQRRWTILKPICHPDANWTLHHSLGVNIVSVVCSQCGDQVFTFMVQPKQY